MLKKIDKLQVILKVAERCNLACSYCYYFFGGDESYKERPALISEKNIAKFVDFINRSVEEVEINILEISFHGGEPMMLPIRKFEAMCKNITENIDSRVQVQLQIQTNATLIDEKWIELFHKYNIGVGISVDGPKLYNDQYRIDHNGKGSYDSIKNGVDKLLKAVSIGTIGTPGSISVINGEFDYEKITTHLHSKMGLKKLSYLFPDVSHDDPLPEKTDINSYTKAFQAIFKVWTESEDLSIRQLNSIFKFFQEKKQMPADLLHEYNTFARISNQIIVVQSDATITVDDSFMPTKSWRLAAPKDNIDSTSLMQFLEHPIFKQINEAHHTLPDKCKECSWQKLCRGGDLENRYSEKNGFNNPSVFCESINQLYLDVVGYLVKNGYSREIILTKLGIN